MPKRYELDGVVYEFPDDATEAEVMATLSDTGGPYAPASRDAVLPPNLRGGGRSTEPTPARMSDDRAHNLITSGNYRALWQDLDREKQAADAAMNRAYGGEDITGGLREVAQGQVARGLVRTASGAGRAATMLRPMGMLAGIARSPLAFAGGVAGGMVADVAGQTASEALGASPDQQRLIGLIASVPGSMAGATGARRLAQAVAPTIYGRGLDLPLEQRKKFDVKAMEQAGLKHGIVASHPDRVDPSLQAVERSVTGLADAYDVAGRPPANPGAIITDAATYAADRQALPARIGDRVESAADLSDIVANAHRDETAPVGLRRLIDIKRAAQRQGLFPTGAKGRPIGPMEKDFQTGLAKAARRTAIAMEPGLEPALNEEKALIGLKESATNAAAHGFNPWKHPMAIMAGLGAGLFSPSSILSLPAGIAAGAGYESLSRPETMHRLAIALSRMGQPASGLDPATQAALLAQLSLRSSP